MPPKALTDKQLKTAASRALRGGSKVAGKMMNGMKSKIAKAPKKSAEKKSWYDKLIKTLS